MALRADVRQLCTKLDATCTKLDATLDIVLRRSLHYELTASEGGKSSHWCVVVLVLQGTVS